MTEDKEVATVASMATRDGDVDQGNAAAVIAGSVAGEDDVVDLDLLFAVLEGQHGERPTDAVEGPAEAAPIPANADLAAAAEAQDFSIVLQSVEAVHAQLLPQIDADDGAGV